jgi:CRP/FNR family transcriptional regulator
MRSTYQSKTIGHFFDSKLTTIQLLKGLPLAVQQTFEAIKHGRDFPAGTIIVADGEPSQGIFVLNHGQAELNLNPKGRRGQRARIVGPGEVLGLSATIANEPYEVTLESVTTCRTDFIPRDDFLRFLHEQPEACFRVVQLLGQTLHESYEQIHLLEKAPSAAVKLASLLLSWCEDGEETGEGISLNIPLTHEGIARMIGTSRETVTRAFGQLKSRRIICQKRSHLHVCKRAELERIVAQGTHVDLPD